MWSELLQKDGAGDELQDLARMFEKKYVSEVSSGFYPHTETPC